MAVSVTVCETSALHACAHTWMYVCVNWIICNKMWSQLTVTVVTVELMDAPSLTCTSYTGFSNTGPLVLGPGTTVTSTIVWEYFPPLSVACK